MSRSAHLPSIVAGFVCLALAVAILVSAGLPERADYTGFLLSDGTRVAPEIGAFAPPFTAVLLTGEPITLSEQRGRLVILNFWATWCVPCEVEMPELQRLQQARPDVRIFAVNTGESPSIVAAWVMRLQLTLDIVLDSDLRIAQAYQVRGQPVTYIIAPDGVIQHILYGATTQTALERLLAP
ncbi:MAG: TlpA disulfide reductase family protein [Chloroflexota bacterium]|nr:TlpA disulfide reductase family protein [Chloroflexota bacterium]